ncbi:hypothetical protein IC582_025417 [Cucumis melo]
MGSRISSKLLLPLEILQHYISGFLISGIFYHLYNQSFYQDLDEISPLTFSVGNTMKRVVVIVASVLVFRNPATSKKSSKKIEEGEEKKD